MLIGGSIEAESRSCARETHEKTRKGKALKNQALEKPSGADFPFQGSRFALVRVVGGNSFRGSG
jgi:hypothetical protein